MRDVNRDCFLSMLLVFALVSSTMLTSMDD